MNKYVRGRRMFFLLTLKRTHLILITFILSTLILSVSFYNASPLMTSTPIDESHNQIIEEILSTRNNGFLNGNLEVIEAMYDKNTKLGTWAYEHQMKKMKYLHNWAEKQGIIFSSIKSKFKIRTVKESSNTVSYNFIASTEYSYVYENEPQTENFFRIGTYHSLKLLKVDNSWLIAKEWYTDPFADSLDLENLKTEEFEEYILSSNPRDFSSLNQRRINAVEYADRYCGAAADEEFGFSYNKKYRDYNPLGGDCANFASQILFEGGKFKKTGTWNYTKDGSKSWVNAQAFKDYMINSSRASLIAKGTYNQVFKASFKLLPGDFVAYEKKGKITHISVVTGADSKGYSLVNCHNTDRYRVPWDLGWNNKNIKFWLVRVHY